MTFNSGGGAIDTPSGIGGTLSHGVTDGGGQMTKSGAGSLTMTAANTLTGGVYIAGGTLALSGSGTLNTGSGTNAVEVNNGATLLFNDNSSSPQHIPGAGGVKIDTGELKMNCTTETQNIAKLITRGRGDDYHEPL